MKEDAAEYIIGMKLNIAKNASIGFHEISFSSHYTDDEFSCVLKWLLLQKKDK